MLSEAINGRAMLRAMGFGPYMNSRFTAAVDQYNTFNYLSTSLVNWTTLLSYSLSFAISTCVRACVCVCVRYVCAGVSVRVCVCDYVCL
jgi:hypothetical protein